MALQWKPLHYSMDLGMDKWLIASGGWILNTLMICGELGVNLHGETSEILEEEHLETMTEWHKKFNAII